MAFLGVKAVLSSRHGPKQDQPTTLTLVGAEAAYDLFRHPGALPLVFCPTGVASLPQSGLRLWIESMEDPRRVAVSEPGVAKEIQPQARACVVERLPGSRQGSLRLRVDGLGSRLVATSLPGPLGWEARGGQRRLRTVTVNGAFLGVVIPDSVEHLSLDYRPPGFHLGVLLGAVAVALACALAIWAAVGSRGKEPRAGMSPQTG